MWNSFESGKDVETRFIASFLEIPQSRDLVTSQSRNLAIKKSKISNNKYNG